MEKAKIRQIFSQLSADNPEPQTELTYTNTYTLLVAVVLSAQATDVGVNKATPALFAVADTPEKMVKLGEAGLKEYIKTIGLYNNKAKNIIKLSETLIAGHGGKVPEDRAALEALPGVGKKTAAVVMNCAFGAPTIAVDTHVFRVSNRLGLVQTKTPEKTEVPLTEVLEGALPLEMMRHAHHWLILHGRYVCTARAPKCGECVIRDWCQWKGRK